MMMSKNIFIDCGFHLGEGLTEFISMLNIDSNWEIHCFEANPACEIHNKISQFSQIGRAHV